ncbi:RNA-directed DNA polymerase, eukaryota [Tanacetum coccineum]
MSGTHDEIPPPPPPPQETQQKPTQQTPQTVSTIKLPILKKGEYDIWAMKIEHYLAHTDYPIWEVIQNGNGPVSVTLDTTNYGTSTSWDIILSRKVNIFMWRLMLDWLPHRMNLSFRGIDIQSISCPSCNGNVESFNHIFFECDIALEVWRLVCIWCDITSPTFTSLEHWKNWTGLWQTSKEKKHRFFAIFVLSLWWLWRFHNSVTFCSHQIRKSDIFDNIQSCSFSWLYHMGHMGCNWADWLKSPLLIARSDSR